MEVDVRSRRPRSSLTPICMLVVAVPVSKGASGNGTGGDGCESNRSM